MTEKENLLGEILSRIADELNISKTMYDKAVSSYEAVGKWLGDGLDYDVVIMPQGSMNLGTVVKPLDDRDDYDIDLVCLLSDGVGLGPKEVKHLVGNRLKENKAYLDKLEQEGKRCWTMQYDEFHMDILPCIPGQGKYVASASTSIKVTDKDKATGGYQFKLSNPAAYHDWFLAKARPSPPILENRKTAGSATEIKPVPSQASELKTPLQKAIQMLKRHRDVVFQDRQDVSPISVIITTLSAHVSPNTDNVYIALKEVLEKMESHILYKNGQYWVPNPVQPAENFAEKWNSEPSKKTAFDEWLVTARRDFVRMTATLVGLDDYAKHFKKILCAKPVERAFNSLGDAMRSSRENGTLRLTGLGTGLAVSKSAVGHPVMPHTFYGQ